MIDLIIEIIRGSKSQKEVKACLTKGDVGNINFKSSDSMIEATKLSFTDKQASAILDLKLYRLIGLDMKRFLHRSKNMKISYITKNL